MKVALVTGASRGIGRAVATGLAAEGLGVIVSASTLTGAESTARAIRAAGGVAEAYPLRFPEPEKIPLLKDLVISRFGRLDVLVNNAGVYLDNPRHLPHSSITNLDPDLLITTMAINVDGPHRLIAAFLPLMKQQNYGRIVNVSSGLGRFGDLDSIGPFYRLSKLALNGLTRIVASEVEQFNILVNAVCPGWVRTDMGGPEAPRSPSDAARGVIWAALLPDGGPSGSFFRDGVPLSWCAT
jgi:NAD(P)-dependent dehydrogenase (short-subunit alcohol dehydrogenase family)